MCGEQSDFNLDGHFGTGSSPRVRGTAAEILGVLANGRFIPACGGEQSEYREHNRRPFRFIPACAGNSVATFLQELPQSVHPRVCGEQWREEVWLPINERFIPACAGNRPLSFCFSTSRSVHPRVCGEQSAFSAFSGLGGRFIPACAGNSHFF